MSAAVAILNVDKDCAMIRNAVGQTPLHIAVENGNFAIVSAICSRNPECARIQVSNCYRFN